MELETVWLGIIGLAAGLLGGLLGIGGSIVMIPAMTEVLGANQHLYQASALMVSFFVGAPALVQHLRAGV
ncbi:MAG: TSUP family transporter, partial [Phycisphaerales bacterium]|nr:TSUP family transporter [Phycisphaerales bacterium]